MTTQAAEFRLNGHLFTLPDGFEIELVAAPPLIDRPIGVDFDEEGRLYVSDSSGSNEPVQKQLESRPHRILRLEDTDGDGRYDTQVIFADRMMFPEGVLWHDGALYVGAPPSIWKLRDTDGDGVADERTEWFKGEVLTGCANDIHGPYLGRDGWFYWTKGGFGKQNLQRPGHPPITDSAAHIYRARPDGSGLESFMAGGMDNPVEIIFTPEGDLIFTTTFYAHPESGKRDGLVHAIYGGLYPKPHGVLDGLKRTGDLMPILTHLGPAAPSGLCRYNSTVFGVEFQGNLFSTLFNMRKVMRHVLRPSGATFASTDSDFLVSDNPDFHPTDVIEDADGSLLVIDTGGWYKLCCPTSQIAKPEVLGAIYRIRRTGAPRVNDPRGLKLPWSTLKPAALARLLDDPRPFVQQRAVTELARRGEGAVKTLRSAVGSDPVTAINAAWALTRLGTPAAVEALKRALREKDRGVRQAALTGLGLWRQGTPELFQSDLLRTDAPALRRAAATALGRSGDKRAVPLLLRAADAPVDRVFEHSVIYALIEIGDRDATRLGLYAGGPHAARAGLIALDQMDHSDLRVQEVAPLLAARDATVRDTANWIVRHRAEWGPDLTTFFRRRLTSANLTAEERDELQQQLAGLAQNVSIQSMMGELLGDDRLARNNRHALLLAMAQSGLREMPALWETNFASILPLMQEGSLRLALGALRALPGSKASPPALSQVLLRLGADPSRPAELRIEALAAIR
ncbi:MAG TPA: PVC-type heme-binding CxxCH protein, partial [Methylomirabilota bacterium]|nr:PVC-type heme-binding CxxCH protein [Methylomirabilota bacterium]